MALIDKSYKKWTRRFQPIADRVREQQQYERQQKAWDRMLDQQRQQQTMQLERERMDLDRQDQESLSEYRNKSLEASKAESEAMSKYRYDALDASKASDAAQLSLREKELNATLAAKEEASKLAADERTYQRGRDAVADERWDKTQSWQQERDKKEDERWQTLHAKDSELDAIKLENEKLRNSALGLDLDDAKAASARKKENLRRVDETRKSTQAMQAINEFTGLDPETMTDDEIMEARAAIVKMHASQQDVELSRRAGAGDQKAILEMQRKRKLDLIDRMTGNDVEAKTIQRTMELRFKGMSPDQIREDYGNDLIIIGGDEISVDDALTRMEMLQYENTMLGVQSSGAGLEESTDPNYQERRSISGSKAQEFSQRRSAGENPEVIGREMYRLNQAGIPISMADVDAYDAETRRTQSERVETQRQQNEQRVASGKVSLGEIRQMTPDQRKQLAHKWSQIASGDEKGRKLDPKFIDEFAADPVAFIESARPGLMTKAFSGRGNYNSTEAAQRRRVYDALDELGIIDDVRREAAAELQRRESMRGVASGAAQESLSGGAR